MNEMIMVSRSVNKNTRMCLFRSLCLNTNQAKIGENLANGD